MDERSLIETLHKIEALHAGATTPGERAAAANACDRILARPKATVVTGPPVAYRFPLAEVTHRVIHEAIHKDSSEAEERPAPSALR